MLRIAHLSLSRAVRLLTLQLLLSAGLAAPSIRAQDAGSIHGTVRAPDGAIVADARVTLIELRRSVFVDGEGNFRFEDVPSGMYHVQVVSTQFGAVVEEATVAGQPVQVDFTVGRSEHTESIVVTASGGGSGSGEVAVPVTVLDRSDLSRKMEATIGDTLAKEPGVSTTYYGPGASRPIIRGQSAGRVRVLENGLGTGDVSSTSPDHAVTIDPLSADRIEIVRGPATLLYGGAAVAGVVNVFDGRIPDHVPQQPLGGTLDLRLGSVADERSGSVALDGGKGQFAWHVQGVARRTDDYSIGGHAVIDDPTSARGVLPNSAVETEQGTLGGSWVGGTGHVGAAVRQFDTLYGVPSEETVQIDMNETRYDLGGGFNTDYGPWNGINFRVGVVDYEHKELEDGEVGTTFLQDWQEGRVELLNGGGGKVSGLSGLQFSNQDLEAIGDEAFLPKNTQESLSAFGHQEVRAGVMRYEAGLRYEAQRNSTSASSLPDRDFDVGSLSFAAAWVPGETYTLGLSVSRAARPPSAEALYADGPHVATSQFIIGDPDLDAEVSLGADLSLRKNQGRLTGELNLFSHRYDDYIFEIPTGAILDGLPVFQVTQADADFQGFEISAVIETLRTDSGHFDVVLLGDYTHAELSDGEPLPYMPPLRWGAELRYDGERWMATAGAVRNEEQDRVPVYVTPTPASTLVNASVGYRLLGKALVQDFLLRGTNLTDEDARVSTSVLKDLAPLPGRDVSLTYRLTF